MMVVYILIGSESELRDCDINILGIFDDINKVLEKIREYEEDITNRACSECDYFCYDYEKKNEEKIRENKCPECNAELHYSPKDFDMIEIQKNEINKGEGEIFYTYKVLENGLIEQTFWETPLKCKTNIRSINEPFVIKA